jgi:putative transcriptional regulator
MKNRLRILRAEREWSQQDLAERLEVSRQTVNSIEKGRYDPSLPLAFKLGRVFEVPIESIFLHEPEVEPEIPRTVLYRSRRDNGGLPEFD